ncbi:MAG: glycosyltransferase [Bacteroidetes bacterium]|nr:glycosyltransferase [Bacteroidota bacterium]
MREKIKILFFTPYAGRTGSEMVLMNFIKHLDKEKFDVRLFAMQNGELLPELQTTIKTYYDDSNDNLQKRILNKIKTKFGFRSRLEKRVLSIHKKFQPDVWYLNTIALNSVLNIALKHKIKFAVHFHELLSQYAILSSGDLNNFVSKSEFTVGCSETVCENLRVLGAKNIFKQYECIDTSVIDEQLKNTPSYKNKLPLKNEETIIVAMSGQRIERKGFDIFVKTAQLLKNENIHFLWLGATKHSGYEFFVEQYVKINQLNNVSVLYPRKEEYYHYLNVIDIFFLSSTEDPFPLVMLEAAYLNKFIVSFNSGGVSEFLQKEKGVIIENIGAEQASRTIKEVISKKNFALSPRTNEFEFSAKKQAVKMESILKNQFKL